MAVIAIQATEITAHSVTLSALVDSSYSTPEQHTVRIRRGSISGPVVVETTTTIPSGTTSGDRVPFTISGLNSNTQYTATLYGTNYEVSTGFETIDDPTPKIATQGQWSDLADRVKSASTSTINTSRIANQAVTNAKIADGTIQASKLAFGSILYDTEYVVGSLNNTDIYMKAKYYSSFPDTAEVQDGNLGVSNIKMLDIRGSASSGGGNLIINGMRFRETDHRVGVRVDEANGNIYRYCNSNGSSYNGTVFFYYTKN